MEAQAALFGLRHPEADLSPRDPAQCCLEPEALRQGATPVRDPSSLRSFGMTQADDRAILSSRAQRGILRRTTSPARDADDSDFDRLGGIYLAAFQRSIGTTSRNHKGG